MKPQIVATLGPSTRNMEILEKMVLSGVGVVRLNFSWGTHDEHSSYARMIRIVAKKFDKKIPIIQDLSGPRITKDGGHCFDRKVSEILTAKDLLDLEFAKKHSVDYVAQSYVGTANDILLLRKAMTERGFNIPIIAKIERQKSLDNLGEIIEASDAIMIARGDLGNEIPFEQIPHIQKVIMEKAILKGKPVITATEMMTSMVNRPVPTRADVSDVTHAILQGTSAVMLSEETAIGKYPVEVVDMMRRIIEEILRRELIVATDSLRLF